ncbi:MAG: alpha-amylase family glycosyl hydrolase [Clostridiales bacterium]|nr:alpha-amylase family glycosyl hydrolase [Clostridiales bacterium]
MKKWVKQWISVVVVGSLLVGSMTGCGSNKDTNVSDSIVSTEQSNDGKQDGAEKQMEYKKKISERQIVVPDKTDKYRTFYEVFVYSYYDSNDDGIGDIAGLTEKLDYLNDGDETTDSDLGVTGIWLMPIMPSTTYHKYDVKDYMNIDPSYGTLEDFDTLIAECNKRNINVIVDLVMNHTSAKHPWFTEACDYLRGLGDGNPNPADCPYVEYYHFSKEAAGGYAPLEGTDWYYEAQFWDQMPDLNLDNEAVREEFKNICQFWLDRGVAGFRLDAVKEYETGKPSDNIEILSWFNAMVKELNPDAYLVGEAWTDQSEYAKYYESGVDSFFDFAYADKDGRIAKVVNGLIQADAYGKSLEESEALYASINENYINAPFYTNHDLARGAGYYSGDYSDNKTKIAAAMNLFMSGNAFIYYGEEIGMKGSGEDENKRLAMIWNSDSSAEGMCKGPDISKPIKMKYGSLEEQQKDSTSVYQYFKDAIRIRNQFPSIIKGRTSYIDGVSSDTLCVIEKSYENEKVCIFYNLSEQSSTVQLGDVILSGNDVLTEEMLEATLVTTKEGVTITDGVMTMPAYSVAVYLVSE